MLAAVYYETGGPDVFRYEDVPDPVCGPDEVLIKVEAVSIEGGDTLNRLGGELTSVPHIVGYQCAGVILEVGDGIDDLSVDDRVVTVGVDGSHAELRVAGRAFCWKIPDSVTTEEAACVPVPFGTADDCLFEFGRLQPGETALIHAGASGVGIAAIQLAKRAGARVLATASSPERLERLVPLLLLPPRKPFMNGNSCSIICRALPTYFGEAATLRAIALRTRSWSAATSTSAPSAKSIARRTLPSRLELKRPLGSGKDAPWAKVSFTAFLYASPVQMMPLDSKTGLFHFHVSMTDGSAPRIAARALAKVSPRQPPSS